MTKEDAMELACKHASDDLVGRPSAWVLTALQEAYEKGKRDGYRSGRAEGRGEAQEQAERWGHDGPFG